MVFVLIYIHVDSPEFTEVIGVYNTKDEAVNQLLETANYREKNGKLTQYMEPTDEYSSFSELKNKVNKDMELHDVDIYRITDIPLKYEKEQYRENKKKKILDDIKWYH